MSRSQPVEARRHVIIAILLMVLLAMTLVTSGCGEQAARMEQNQIRLQAMIMANARELSTISSQMDRRQKLADQAFAKVSQNTQEISTQVQTVQREQAQLHGALLDGNQQINRKIAQLERNQTHLKDGIAQVGNIAQSTNAAVGAVAKDQATLHQLVQDNQRELARKQEVLHRLAQDNNQRVVEHLTTLASNQQRLDTDVENLHSLTQKVATNVNTLETQQTALQNSLNSNTTTLADKIALLEQHQLDVQSVIDRVANTTSHTADDVVALAAAQEKMQQTQRTHYSALDATLGTIAQDQQGLQTGIDNLHQKADQTSAHLTSLAAGQQATQEILQANNTSVMENFTNLSSSQQALQEDIKTLNHSTEAITTDLDTVMTNQSTLQGQLVATNEQLGIFAENQTTLQQSINDLDGKAEAMASNVSSIAAELGSVHDSVKAGIETLTEGQQKLNNSMTQVDQTTQQVANDQRSIQDGVNSVMATTSLLSLNTVTMSNRQAEFEQEMRTELTDLSLGTDQLVTGQGALTAMIERNEETLSGQIAGLAVDQKTFKNDVETLTASTSQLSLDLAGVDERQSVLQRTLETGFDDLAQDATQLAADLKNVSDRQNSMGQTLTAHNETVSGQITHLAQGQQGLAGGLDTLTATTTQIALDVITLDNNQDDIQQAVRTNGQDVAVELTKLGQGQNQMQSGLDTLTATTTQTALDVINLDGNQAEIEEAVRANGQQLATGLTQIAERQGLMQSGLDTLTATTTQVALDVIAIDENQTEQEAALRSNHDELTSTLTGVVQEQGQLKSGLETVTATTSQVALDVIALDDNQAKLEQAVQANRQELVTKLAEIAQGQQQWLARFDAAQAQVETMTAGITALEQRVTKLQGTLQTSLQDLSALLDAESQQRVQFEQSVRQEMQGVADTISQLREVQAGLADHLQRMQDSSQSQTEDVLSALEQLQQKTNTEASAVDTELQSSKAMPQQISLP